MRRNAHIVGLQGTSVRARLDFIRAALEILRDPEVYSTDPIAYGQAHQRISDAFDVWGREKTLEDKSIIHNLGMTQLATLEKFYEQWKEQHHE